MRNQIHVDVKTKYLAEQSDPKAERFVFGYTITLTNEGDAAAQLISRHWVITDSNNEVQEVRGFGVIGQQPTIAPGDSYTYSSGVVLPTETGTMTGSYQMRTHEGEDFEASIPVFALVPPHRLH